MFPREMKPLNPPLSDPSYQRCEKHRFPFILRLPRLIPRRRTLTCQPFYHIFEHGFFDYETAEDLEEEMFHERRRDWEARIVRDSMELKRVNSQNASLMSKRSHSTLERIPSINEILPLNQIGQRALGDREERRKGKLYTSSAFDATKPNDKGKTNNRPCEDDPCSPVSPEPPSVPPSNPSRWRKTNLTIEIPEPKVPKQVVFRGQLPEDHHRSKQANESEVLNRENRFSIHGSDSNKELRRLPAASSQRTMLRVTSNFERSLCPSMDASFAASRERNSIMNIKTSNRTPLDYEESDPVLQSNMNFHGDPHFRRHADRTRTPRNDGLRPRVTCSPTPFAGQASSSNLHATRSFSNKLDSNSSVSKALSFAFTEDDQEEAQVVRVEDALKDRTRDLSRGDGRSREGSDFSKLSADSWRTIESEQELTEREARIFTSSSSSGYQNTTVSSGTLSTHYSADHDPQTLFGVDCRGDLLERMSNDNPYCLSVLECCALLQTGSDISKKLTFSRCEQRRVWMSSDFLFLCWSSKKSSMNEDQIELSKIARMKLTDKNLVIDMICGYNICFVFPSVTTAGLWVRALSCLVPLQANIKVPLGVIIPTETEREEFSLAEDVFGNKHVREYTSVNEYIALCNPIFVPPNMGFKLAFSVSEDRFYGFRYIPRKAIRYMLRTRKEIAILKTLKHKHIVQYREVLEDPERGGMYVVYEHLSRGCIADSANLHRMPIFKEAQVRVVMVDIINALLYLHARRISHGDIRPESVLMTANGEAKLNPIGCIMHDFSSINSKIAHVRCRLGTSCHAFIAPEQCWLTRAPTAGKESTAVDVWGVAALMFSLLFGKTPFHGSNNYEVQENICWGTIRFPLDPHVSKEAKSLMFQILSNKDPRTRMKLVEVRDHPWFHEYSILSPTSSRLRFPDYFESGINDSSLTDFSEDDLSGAVQPAKLRITAKKRDTKKVRK